MAELKLGCAQMSPKAKSGVDASTADRLVDAAEDLYGRHGLDGPSLRQISLAAGTGNNFAVQYHFGDTAGLIHAILLKRIPRLEMERAKLLARIKARDDCSSRTLIEAMLRPAIDQVNDCGERTSARFLLALASTPAGSKHLGEVDHLLPVNKEIFDLLYQLNPAIPPPLLRERVRLVALMVLNSVFNRLAPYVDEDLDSDLIENALDMASAAVTAPVATGSRAPYG